LRKLTKLAQGAGTAAFPDTSYPALCETEDAFSLFKRICPIGKVERFLDAKERNDDESR
jgi:hypothetical protein